MKLYPFQEIGVSWLKTRENALLADSMGLGKSCQAIIASISPETERVLIVCPASLKYVWQREIRKWVGNTDIIAIVDSKKPWASFAFWTIVNYDLLLNKEIYMSLLKHEYSIGIFDEAHYLKNGDAKRTKAVLMRGGLASRCKKKWYLTGTPILNRPIELYPMLKASAPEVMHPFTTYIGFAKYFCGGFYDNFGFNDRGASHIDELNSALIKSGFMLRRTKEEVLPDLPEKTFEIIPVDVDAKKEFEFFWAKDDVSKKSFGDFFNKEDPGMLGKVAALRQYIAKEKIKHVLQHLKNLLQEKPKVVVFAHHREIVDLLCGHLGEYKPVKVVGGMTAEAKDKAEQDFQTKSEVRLFVGNIQAAGVGLTLTAADTVVFAELDWTPGNILQASDRIHRIGQKNACVIQIFVTKDSIEEYILRRLVEKKEVCERVLQSNDSIFS